LQKGAQKNILIGLQELDLESKEFLHSRIPPKNSCSVVEGDGNSGQNKDIARKPKKNLK